MLAVCTCSYNAFVSDIGFPFTPSSSLLPSPSSSSFLVVFSFLDAGANEPSDTPDPKGKSKRDKYHFAKCDEIFSHYVKNECTKKDAEEWLADDAAGTYLFRKGERTSHG